MCLQHIFKEWRKIEGKAVAGCCKRKQAPEALQSCDDEAMRKKGADNSAFFILMLISGRLAAERTQERTERTKPERNKQARKLRESQLSEGLSVKTGTVTQYLFCQELNKTERLRYTRKHRNGVPVGTHFLLDKGTPLNPFGENRSDELTGRTAATNHERSTRKRTPNEVREIVEICGLKFDTLKFLRHRYTRGREQEKTQRSGEEAVRTRRGRGEEPTGGRGTLRARALDFTPSLLKNLLATINGINAVALRA